MVDGALGRNRTPKLAATAVQGRDYPVIMAINLISAVTIVFSNLLADVIYAVIAPRIKYS